MTLGVYRRTDSARLSVSVVIYSVQEKDGNEGLMLKSCLSLRSYNRAYNARKYSMSVDTFCIGNVVKDRVAGGERVFYLSNTVCFSSNA